MVEKTFIYGLYDVNDPKKEIRYIGKADNPEKRLLRHINNTKYRKKINSKLTHKECWIISCKYQISFTVLKECTLDDWCEIEKKLIKDCKNLTNTSSGGEGGSGVIYKINYEECKNWVQTNMSIKSKNDWFVHIKNDLLPDFIPKHPRQKYINNGWVSWGDFLGTGRISDNYVNYLTYEESKKIIHKLGVTKVVEYKQLAKNNLIPKNIPNRPERYYEKRGWVGWSDFLGCKIVANQKKEFYSLEDFKKKLQTLNIKKMLEYKKYCNSIYRDSKMPTNPLTVYRRINKKINWYNLVNL
jgi:hypothetical protein